MQLNDEWENLISDVGYQEVTGFDNVSLEKITVESILFCRHEGVIYPVALGYYGLFQWGKDRREELFGKTYEMETEVMEGEGWKSIFVQCEYALDEYNQKTKENTEWSNNRFKLEDGEILLGTKDEFENAQSASDAALVWALGFERCVDKETSYEDDEGHTIYTQLRGLDTRLTEAENIYKEFANKN